MGLRILVAEAEVAFRRDISRILERHDIVETASGAEARGALRRDDFPLVITNGVVGDECGLDLMEEAKSLNPEGLVIVTIGRGEVDAALRAIRSGAFDFLVKPSDVVLMSAVLRRATDLIKLKRENKNLVNSLKRHVEAFGVQSRRLEHMAIRDGLTDLYNYRYLKEAFDRELARCRRYDRRLSLIFADIDSFKNYNDTQGHLAGDALLTRLGKIITDDSRKSTTIARYGGEEFVLLVPETDHVGALAYAEKLRKLVERYPFDGRETQPGGRITLSLGVATFPEHGTDANALIRFADQALYRAKRFGRNTVCGVKLLAAQ